MVITGPRPGKGNRTARASTGSRFDTVGGAAVVYEHVAQAVLPRRAPGERQPVKIAYTSDLHIDVSAGNRGATAAVARLMRQMRPDAVVVAGDAGNTIEALEEALSLFDGIEAQKLFVPGNHDVWIENEGDDLADSRLKYARRIPEACARRGFHDLGREPVVIGDVALVGSLGWYDYSFADPRLGLTEAEYWRGRYGDEIWWDKKMTYWVPDAAATGTAPRERMPDIDVCREMFARLDEDLRAVENRAKRIVAVVHTLPFFVGIPRSDPPYYLDAYTGSSAIGDLLVRHAKVAHCIHGHKHSSGEWTAGGIRLYRRALGRIDEGEDAEVRAASAVGLIEV
jgi:3',5'-cyclic AMP phosphodiesterase CpdA